MNPRTWIAPAVAALAFFASGIGSSLAQESVTLRMILIAPEERWIFPLK